MHTITEANEAAETATRAAVEAAVTMIVGLDVHATQITACWQRGGRIPQPAQKRSWDQLLEEVAKAKRCGYVVYSCYEAGPCGYGLHRRLTQLGAVNYVVAPQSWDERQRRVKTDRRDARLLCHRLGRYVAGDLEAFSVVRVPTPEQEQRRLLCRQRDTLVKERQRCEVRGHGLMLTQGIRGPASWWEPAVWADLRPELPGWLVPHLQRWGEQAQQLQSQIEHLTPQLEGLSVGQRVPKGLGAMSAAKLTAEILDWGRFTNRRQPASYTGLCPGEASSGQRRRQGSVTKHGNPRVRHLLVEAIWRMLQWQPDYPPLKKLRGTIGARARKRLAVAAARRLAVDLWRIYTGRNTPEELHLHMTTL